MLAPSRGGCSDSLSIACVAPPPSLLNLLENGRDADKQISIQERTSETQGDAHVCSRLRHDTPSKTINDLPPEIINGILDAVFHEMNDLPHFLGGNYLITLKHLAAVCSRWKTIIQSTPAFWTTTESTNTPADMKYMLRKSGNCLLTFRHLIDSGQGVFRTRGFNGFDFLGFASSNMARCSSLSVVIKWCSQAACIVGSPAPKLRKATIVASDCDIDEDVDLFGGQAAVLEDLRLSQIPIKWDLGLPSTLRRVEIFYHSTPIARLPHPRQIVYALCGCPEIEVLRLVGTQRSLGRLEWAELGVQGPQVELPTLKELWLENMAVNGSGYILRSLLAPILRSLEVKESSHLDSVAALLHPPSPILLESIRRTIPHRHFFSVTIHPETIYSVISGEEQHVGLSIYCRDPDEMNFWLAKEFASELASVSELRLGVSPTCQDTKFKGLRQLMGAVSNVIRLRCAWAKAGAAVLARHLGSPCQAGDGWRWHWPGLRQLTLYEAWEWHELALTMIQERYGSYKQEDGDGDSGTPKWYPCPLTSLRLRDMKLIHPETYREIAVIVGDGVLEED